MVHFEFKDMLLGLVLARKHLHDKTQTTQVSIHNSYPIFVHYYYLIIFTTVCDFNSQSKFNNKLSIIFEHNTFLDTFILSY